MLFRDHRIVQGVVLVIEFDDRAGQLRAFLDAEALRQGTGGDIADDHLEGDDLDLPDELLAHVEAANEVCRHADIVQILEDVFRNPVVQHAFAVDDLVLLRVEGGRVILEVLDERAGLRSLVEDLRLALVDATAAVHWCVPWFEKIHEMPWLLGKDDQIRGSRGPSLGDQQARLARNLPDPSGEHNEPLGHPPEG